MRGQDIDMLTSLIWWLPCAIKGFRDHIHHVSRPRLPLVLVSMCLQQHRQSNHSKPFARSRLSQGNLLISNSLCDDECKMNDEPERTSFTCISPDPHEHISDHILHFLACVNFSERNEFLSTRSNLSSTEKAWREDCLSELRRIAFLRSKLKEEKSETHLIQSINESRKAWKTSTVYKNGIQEVKQWRNSAESPTGEDSEPEVHFQWAYEPDRDVNTPFMLFKKQENVITTYEADEENVDPKNAIWGKFPDQQTNVQRLLFDKEDMDHRKQDLLHRRNNHGTNNEGTNYERIRYFHIPSNNMMVSLYASEIYQSKMISTDRSYPEVGRGKVSIVLIKNPK